MIYYITKYRIPDGYERGIWIFIERKFNLKEINSNDISTNIIKLKLSDGNKSEIIKYGYCRIKEKDLIHLL